MDASWELGQSHWKCRSLRHSRLTILESNGWAQKMTIRPMEILCHPLKQREAPCLVSTMCGPKDKPCCLLGSRPSFSMDLLAWSCPKTQPRRVIKLPRTSNWQMSQKAIWHQWMAKNVSLGCMIANLSNFLGDRPLAVFFSPALNRNHLRFTF